MDFLFCPKKVELTERGHNTAVNALFASLEGRE